MLTFPSGGGTNQQLFQKDLVLPAAGTPCTLEFDACSTGGPCDPGFGHNFGLKLIKHTGPPFTNYGLNLSGNPPNPQVDLSSCSAGPVCGDGTVDSPNAAGQFEDCDTGGNSAACDSDCTLPVCGDGLFNAAAGEQCDDGNLLDGDGCSAGCLLEPFCADGFADAGEDCDNGGGTFLDQTTTPSATCDSDCTSAACGDGTLNTAAGELCDDGNLFNGDGCDANCNPDDGECDINYGRLDGDDLWLYGRLICPQPTVEIGQINGIPVNVTGGITASNSQEIHVDLSGFGLSFQDDAFCKVIVSCPGDQIKEIDVSLPSTGPQGPQGPQGKIGPTGSTGAVGAQGSHGKIGPTGPTANDGAQGPQGKIGPTDRVCQVSQDLGTQSPSPDVIPDRLGQQTGDALVGFLCEFAQVVPGRLADPGN